DYGEGSLGGKFRGKVRNVQSGQIVGPINAERIPGLDSNSGADWRSQGARSFGLENRGAGNRGSDPIPVSKIVLNEIDDSPDLLELRNTGTSLVDMENWYLLASGLQGQAHALIKPPFRNGLLFSVMAANQYVVLGEGGTPPAEKP